MSKDNNENADTINEQENGDIKTDKKKCSKKYDYVSDSMKENYYKKSWRELCKEAGTDKTEDTDFMDILVESMRDTNKHKNIQKKKFFRLEIFLIALAFINTILNSVKALPYLEEWINATINFLCIFLSAFIAFITSYEFLIKPKETWLRQMSFYINITIEADRLFGGAEEYKCSPRDRIDKFKSNIVKYTSEDYQNFLANMSGTRISSDSDNKDRK